MTEEGNKNVYPVDPALNAGTLPFIDKTRIAVTGHSRGSKTVLLTYALDDRWSNPEGMVQGAWATGEVYRFLGAPENLAFRLRPGAHAHSVEDWGVFLDFLGWKWNSRQPTVPYNTHPYTHLHPAWAWKKPS